MPDKIITFEGQKPKEQVINFGRKHPLVMSKMGLIILAVALLIFGLFLKFGFSSVTSYITIITGIIGAVYFSRCWFIYNHSIYIISSDRVISMDQRGFFSRRVSESALDKIVNVTQDVKGLVRTIFDFGDIVIQTSGSGNENSIIKLIDVPDPGELQKKITHTASEFAGTEIEVDLGKR